MAIDRSKLQRMYKLMADNGYTQDYNTFEKKFTGNSNYANRKAVYDLFTKNGADLGGSYEVFMRKLQKPRATKPQQQPKTALGRAQQSVELILGRRYLASRPIINNYSIPQLA